MEIMQQENVLDVSFLAHLVTILVLKVYAFLAKLDQGFTSIPLIFLALILVLKNIMQIIA